MINYHQNKREQSAISRLLFSFVLSLCSIFSFAQNDSYTKGFRTASTQSAGSSFYSDSLKNKKLKEFAIGYSIIHEQLPEGHEYTPLFVTARFPIHQFPSKKKGGFKVFAEPQFVLNNAPEPFPTTFEFGVNVGIQYFLSLSKRSGFSASISAGPHYLSLETAIQAKGFIFSDNFEVGYYQMLGERLGISIKPRFRHISNAGFLSPNIGIDNLFLMVGIFWKKQ